MTVAETVRHSGFRHFIHHVKYGVGVVAVNMALFPLEHWAWENLPVLRNVTEAMGL